MKPRPVRLKRVCEQPGTDDGMRVLVDRLWPRGLSRQELAADLWLRDAAPSSALRRWYRHDPRRWGQFARKYRNELARRPEVLELLDDLRRRTPLTLIFGARDGVHSHAVVLRRLLEARSRSRSSRRVLRKAGRGRHP